MRHYRKPKYIIKDKFVITKELYEKRSEEFEEFLELVDNDVRTYANTFHKRKTKSVGLMGLAETFRSSQGSSSVKESKER